MTSGKLHNPTPLEILTEEFLKPMGIDLRLFLNGKCRVTPALDKFLCKGVGLSEGCFLRLQTAYDEREVKRK